MVNHPNRAVKINAELLAALKDIVEVIDFDKGACKDDTGRGGRAEQLLIATRAAIARAETVS